MGTCQRKTKNTKVQRIIKYDLKNKISSDSKTTMIVWAGSCVIPQWKHV